jgi:putative ABC transport system permease protein
MDPLRTVAAVLRRLRAPFDHARHEREMSDEMRFHLDMEAQDLVAHGLNPAEARRRALAAFGGERRFREEGHDARGSHWLADFAQDLRYAWRTLLHNRGYAAIAILTLALGVGATTTIFGVVNGVLLRPMPYHAPEKLFLVWDDLGWIGVPEAWVTGREVLTLRSSLTKFNGLSALRGSNAALSGDGDDPEQIVVTYGSANFFDVLGMRPALGRGFAPEEERPGAERVAVISNGLWRRRFAANRSIIGRRILLDDAPVTVVGVMPAAAPFSLETSLGSPLRIDAYMPLQADFAATPPGAHGFGVLARVRDDATIGQGLAELSALSRRVDDADYHHHFRFVPVGVQERMVREVRPALVALMAAVVVLLLIMSANLATLALTRSARREREFAIRKALGAARARITRQVLTETVALATAGALGGVAVAYWGLRGLLAMAPPGLPRRDEVGIDFVVFGFTLGVGLLIGLAVGLAPVAQSIRRDLSSVMRERAPSLHSAHRTRGFLVLGQMALSLLLLAATGVLLSSFVRLLRVDPGFDAADVVAVSLRMNPARYAHHGIDQFAQRALDGLSRIPGVRLVGATSAPPLSADADQYNVSFPASPTNTGDQRHDRILIDVAVATPGYFGSLGVRIMDGREFGVGDDPAAPAVGIIDDVLARRYFPGGSAVGQRMYLDDDTVLVVGVVQQVRLYNIQEEGRAQIYRPEAQFPSRSLTFVLRGTAGHLDGLPDAARAVFRAMDPAQPIISIDPMTRIVAESLAERRLVLVLVGAFGVTALFLAALGVYGVTSAAVAQRTRELGIRMALGARPGEVVALMLRRPLLLLAAGVGIGLGGTIALAGVTRRLLFQASPTDPATLAVVVAVLAIVALVAGYVPARRAARVEPASILRSD